MLLVRMANFGRPKAIINAAFEGLSIVNIAISSTRLALQYYARTKRICYIAVTLWLTVEAAVAIIMASISSYRVIALHFIEERATLQPEFDQAPLPKMHRMWFMAGHQRQSAYSASANAAPHHVIQIASGCLKPAVDDTFRTG